MSNKISTDIFHNKNSMRLLILFSLCMNRKCLFSYTQEDTTRRNIVQIKQCNSADLAPSQGHCILFAFEFEPVPLKCLLCHVFKCINPLFKVNFIGYFNFSPAPCNNGFIFRSPTDTNLTTDFNLTKFCPRVSHLI